MRGSWRRVAVSSRGQDTWFSATGPGFESPYRYQIGCTDGLHRLIEVVAELSDGQHWEFTPGAHLLKAAFQVLDCGEDLSRRDPETRRCAVFLGPHFT